MSRFIIEFDEHLSDHLKYGGTYTELLTSSPLLLGKSKELQLPAIIALPVVTFMVRIFLKR